MEKKILYIHRKDVDKVNKVRGCGHHPKDSAAVCTGRGNTESAGGRGAFEIHRIFPKEVGEFLTDLKKLGIRVDLKCMETEHNRDWSLLQLYKELEEEHRYMTARRQEQQNEEKSS